MSKSKINTIHEKNKIINNIINAMTKRKNFLICGHTNPDEDCVSSMVAVALLLNKFDKQTQVFINGNIPENITYLLNIAKYNSIKILYKNSKIPEDIDTIFICDTPKGSMLNINNKISHLFSNKSIIKIEIDHHLGADSDYIGDKGYRLVTEASSASELVGLLALKINKKKDILNKFIISDTLSRNFVLAVVTGIVGDTNMGRFLKSRREKKFYDLFSRLYNKILMVKTVKESNFMEMNEVFKELQKHSEKEENCFKYMIKKEKYSKSIGYIILNKKDIRQLFKEFDQDIIITVTRYVANELAERSTKLSLITYYDNVNVSNLIHFRMRRSHNYKKFDLRKVLEIFSIKDGGGHEGAIAFRFPRNNINNLEDYVQTLVNRVEEEIR